MRRGAARPAEKPWILQENRCNPEPEGVYWSRAKEAENREGPGPPVPEAQGASGTISLEKL